MLTLEEIHNRYIIEEKENWKHWAQEIPFLQFDPSWKVKIIPPSAGAIIRFWVEKGNSSVSVYLDCLDRLGNVGEPYWEVYPVGDDVERFVMRATDELMECIKNSLQKQEENL